jgi:hypothetical protein
MHDGALRAAQALETAQDEILACLGQHLDRDVIGDGVGFDQVAHEVEVGLRSRGERDLDLLEADPDQRVEHPALALAVHRFDQRLVAVAQVGAAPYGHLRDGSRGPGPIGEGDRGEGSILGAGVGQHRLLLCMLRYRGETQGEETSPRHHRGKTTTECGGG